MRHETGKSGAVFFSLLASECPTEKELAGIWESFKGQVTLRINKEYQGSRRQPGDLSSFGWQVGGTDSPKHGCVGVGPA